LPLYALFYAQRLPPPARCRHHRLISYDVCFRQALLLCRHAMLLVDLAMPPLRFSPRFRVVCRDITRRPMPLLRAMRAVSLT